MKCFRIIYHIYILYILNLFLLYACPDDGIHVLVFRSQDTYEFARRFEKKPDRSDSNIRIQATD